MTFKSLMNFAGFHNPAPPVYPAIDRYHGGHEHHSHGWHGSKKGGGKGNGAALSALTLLSFLFLLNVMQQSLMDNNATDTTTQTTIFLRQDQQPISLPTGVNDRSAEKDSSESTVKQNNKKEISYVKL